MSQVNPPRGGGTPTPPTPPGGPPSPPLFVAAGGFLLSQMLAEKRRLDEQRAAQQLLTPPASGPAATDLPSFTKDQLAQLSKLLGNFGGVLSQAELMSFLGSSTSSGDFSSMLKSLVGSIQTFLTQATGSPALPSIDGQNLSDLAPKLLSALAMLSPSALGMILYVAMGSKAQDGDAFKADLDHFAKEHPQLQPLVDSVKKRELIYWWLPKNGTWSSDAISGFSQSLSAWMGYSKGVFPCAFDTGALTGIWSILKPYMEVMGQASTAYGNTDLKGFEAISALQTALALLPNAGQSLVSQWSMLRSRGAGVGDLKDFVDEAVAQELYGLVKSGAIPQDQIDSLLSAMSNQFSSSGDLSAGLKDIQSRIDQMIASGAAPSSESLDGLVAGSLTWIFGTLTPTPENPQDAILGLESPQQTAARQQQQALQAQAQREAQMLQDSEQASKRQGAQEDLRG